LPQLKFQPSYVYICMYICIYIHTHTLIYIYIYIYRERERETNRDKNREIQDLCTCVHPCFTTYLTLYPTQRKYMINTDKRFSLHALQSYGQLVRPFSSAKIWSLLPEPLAFIFCSSGFLLKGSQPWYPACHMTCAEIGRTWVKISSRSYRTSWGRIQMPTLYWTNLSNDLSSHESK